MLLRVALEGLLTLEELRPTSRLLSTYYVPGSVPVLLDISSH